jgi:hypothetical protein
MIIFATIYELLSNVPAVWEFDSVVLKEGGGGDDGVRQPFVL